MRGSTDFPLLLSSGPVGEPRFGIIQTQPSANFTELAAEAGYNFIVFDFEHGLFDDRQLLHCVRATAHSEALSIVRPRWNDYHAIGRYLDLGVDGILMPDIQSGEEAAAFVRATQFGTKGTRSTNSVARCSILGINNSSPILLALIESSSGLASVVAIAETKGISGLFIGPNDLASDLECKGDLASRAFKTACSTIEHAAHRAGLLLGGAVHSATSVQMLVDDGYRFIVVSNDIAATRAGLRQALPSGVMEMSKPPKSKRKEL